MLSIHRLARTNTSISIISTNIGISILSTQYTTNTGIRYYYINVLLVLIPALVYYKGQHLPSHDNDPLLDIVLHMVHCHPIDFYTRTVRDGGG